VGERVERARDHYQVRALIDRIDGGGGVDLGELDAVAEQRLKLAHRAGEKHHVAVETVFGEQTEFFRRPDRRLKAGEAGVSDEVGFLGACVSGENEKKEKVNNPSLYHGFGL